ncbi:phage tail assembly protein T [Serratia marcescens]|uniref:phage tail assembly protein T n=1 Tax=Serratia marcescens TaxID=615 RepID=UPI0019811DED|nr:phage tail protein [Serratia marcescens]MBN3978307.1 phage tail protein [Serratia marcescens]
MNGIGGRTVAEAQEKMLLVEYRLWVKYREKYGTLNPMMRTEWGAALVASVLANINRSKNSPPFEVSDFAPHINEKPISIEDAMENWR